MHAAKPGPWTRVIRVLGPLLLATATVMSPPVMFEAAAEPCPDIQVVFARGTSEAPGIGYVGRAFVDSLQAQVTPRSVDVHPVVYPATIDFPSAAQGVVDATSHLREMAANCPKTKTVLGGYSQGAAVIGYVTAAMIPEGYTVPADITGPLSPEIANHVSAVALFGQPSSRFLIAINAPPVVIGPLYAPKTVNECIPGDLVCSLEGSDFGAHGRYVSSGLTDDAATFTADRLATASSFR